MVELANFDVRAMFPTFVWVMDLAPGIHEPLNRRVMHDLNALTSPRPQLRPGQNWQTEQNLHEFEEFDDLIRVFKECSGEVLEKWEIEYQSFEITGCWANINPRGAFHAPHSHPNNFLSGIYYVQALPGADSVSFHDPRTQPHIISPVAKRDNEVNATLRDLEVKAGRLIMFPAWLVHSVSLNKSDQLRISISFNVMFSPYVETISKPKWSGIPLKRK